MTASILGRLDRLADEHPDKLLYSYLDVSGDPIESYTYASFLHRAQAIAGHLCKAGRFAAADRLLLAYPPGLEMICAFFGCVRAGLVPVPVYPPSSRGFQSALYKMVHIAKDCQAAGILTSRDYHASLKTNLARSGVSACGVDVDYISGLPWIATEDFVDAISDRPAVDPSKILFLQYTSGSTMEPKGVIVTHENILNTCPLVIDHPSPVVVSWLPQYHDMGLIGCYLYPALKGGTTYGFAPMDFIQRPILWFDAMTTYHATATAAPNFAYDYCLRAGRLSKESLEACDLSSLRVLMCAAEPVKPDTYTRFLEAFQCYGLKSESFYVAYGLAENTLAVSLGGRNIVSVNKRALALGTARMTREVSEIGGATQIVSCGTPLPGLDVKIVDPEGHFALRPERTGEIWVAGSGKCRGYWNNPELTLKQFRARLVDDTPYDDGYLRTGDIGFF
ncbi:MAG: AMP-binding protein, partial [Candidatus Acidiferrum sp.]